MSIQQTPSGEIEITMREAMTMVNESAHAMNESLVEAIREEIAGLPNDQRIAARRLLGSTFFRWKEKIK